MYLIKQILEEKGETIGLIPVGRFKSEAARDNAFYKYFINNKKGLRSGEE